MLTDCRYSQYCVYFDAEKNPCNNDNDINFCAAAWEFLMFNESRKLNKGANSITV